MWHTVAIAALVTAVGAGCNSSEEERITRLEKRIFDLERELAAAKAQTASRPTPVSPAAEVAASPQTPKAVASGLPIAGPHSTWKSVPIDAISEKGLKWLISVQGKDGGWGQDGGNEGDTRQGERLESSGNDVANTSLVCLALLRTGTTPKEGAYREALQNGIKFILSHIEEAPGDGLSITKRTGTQIQRKLGPYIDTFLATMVLSEVDGQMADESSQKRVRAGLERCVAKVEKSQMKDGSWNFAGGWAPIIGTSIASRGLYGAQQKGVVVQNETLARVEEYTRSNFDAKTKSFRSKDGAGVELYAAAQALEQASRPEARASTPADPKADPRPAESPSLGFKAGEAESVRKTAQAKLADTRFVGGFGSMGGEEFVSYMNISDSLLRAGGKEWSDWNGKIKERIQKLQNQDGTWAGHHCITGRVACTAVAVLTMLTERTAPRME
jgi:hypothetical protein